MACNRWPMLAANQKCCPRRHGDQETPVQIARVTHAKLAPNDREIIRCSWMFTYSILQFSIIPAIRGNYNILRVPQCEAARSRENEN
eukprot:s3508_g4.t1